MQRRSRLPIILLLLAGALAGGFVALAAWHVPSPMRTIEKPLHAKAILSPGQ